MKIAIRVDASPVIGSGHLMRCLTLADRLAAADAQVRFVCRQMPQSLEALIRDAGHECARLPALAAGDFTPTADDSPHAGWLGIEWTIDADETAAALADQPAWDWLIVDHYGLDTRWQGRMRQAAKRIMVIDDLADRAHDCDLLLDQNLYADMAARYTEHVPANCRLLLGPRHALLRAAFATLRAKVQPRDGEVKRLLVFLGGMDAGNVTSIVLQALDKLPRREFATDVVIGAGHPAREAIERECARLGLTCHVQTPRMAELMAAADLAIGAGGTATWERCALALPAIIVVIANNQREIAAAIHQNGAAISVGEITASLMNEIKSQLLVLLSDPKRLRTMSAAAYSLTDGEGASRVVKSMEE